MDVTTLLNNAALEFSDFSLPSKGKVYASGVESVKVRPTRTAEEKYLRTIAKGSADFNEKISRYLGMITDLKETGLDPIELTVPDQLALLVFSRILSKDTIEYPVEVICPKCGKLSRNVVKLLELQMIYLPDDFIEPVELCMPLHDLYMDVRLIRVKDHMNVSDFHKTMKDANVALDDPEDDLEGLYASTISNIRKMVDGELQEVSMTYSDKRALLQNLDARSFNLISALQDKYYHGYDLNLDLNCPSCLEKSRVPFELNSDFFFKITSTAA